MIKVIEGPPKYWGPFYFVQLFGMVLVIFKRMKHLIATMLLFGCVGQAQTITERRAEVTSRNEQVASLEIVKQEDGIFLLGEYEDILAMAEKENKEVILHFGADWCLPCKQMKRMTYPNSIVKQKIEEGYLPFEVDVDFFWGMDIAENFGVTKYPTIILLRPNGKEKTRHEGYLGPREMYRLLRNY